MGFSWRKRGVGLSVALGKEHEFRVLQCFYQGGRFYGNENDLLRGEPDFGFTQTSITLGPDIGSRWVSPWGLSVVARIGYGYTWNIFNGAPTDRRTQDWLQLSSGLDYELSLGYAF